MVEYQELQAQQQQILDVLREEFVKANLQGKILKKHEALLLLKKLSFPPHIINHQLAVMRKALKFAHSIHNKPINIDLIRTGALLHDIGRFASHELLHTSLGGDIIRRLGFSEELARIAETHSLGGFTSEEAVRLGLPPRDYMPRSIEEKIVCLSDKLISGTEKVTIEQRFARWIEKYGANDFLMEQIRRVKAIEDEILHIIYD